MKPKPVQSFLLLAVFTFFIFVGTQEPMSTHTHRIAFMAHGEAAMHDLLPEGKYACCLKKPCISCLQLTPWHGEGAECSCLADIMNGEGPCGECMGGILAGRGNPLISRYFATALAEEMGEQHTDVLKQMMFEKYGVPVSEQI